MAFGMLACGKNGSNAPANQLAGNDFESLEGWTGDMVIGSLTKDKAHSGRYAIKVDPNIEYSAGYNNLLGKLSASKLQKLKVHAWVNIPNGKAASVLVVCVLDPVTNKQLYWDAIGLGKEVKVFNKWVEVEKTFTLPAEATYNHKLSVYLWRTSSPETAYLDDLSIEKAE